jgi:hypothetical protein
MAIDSGLVIGAHLLCVSFFSGGRAAALRNWREVGVGQKECKIFF